MFPIILRSLITSSINGTWVNTVDYSWMTGYCLSDAEKVLIRVMAEISKNV